MNTYQTALSFLAFIAFVIALILGTLSLFYFLFYFLGKKLNSRFDLDLDLPVFGYEATFQTGLLSVCAGCSSAVLAAIAKVV
jgi:hypothetical protein